MPRSSPHTDVRPAVRDAPLASSHRTGKRVVCGHTSQKNGLPKVWEGWACIDTWPAGGEWLSCLDVETNELVQANQSGATRRFQLGASPPST
ncbi:hypothetical protein [Pseudobythopirellula maris]|uniref:hypothetical protein n=1 Tax=Pseudobythopirellula maris TaxID=2527991 RepID=UPI0011B4A746|nr:hypothetical protein [Pseudobythopirellula maris]